MQSSCFPKWACLAALLLCALVGCGEPEAVRIGFLGGLSGGRYTNLGESGRNGLLLAIEERNAAGGIGGKRVELVIKDDAQNEATAIKAANELLASGIVAIIGPMTSSMATAVLPAVETRNIPLVSPTATSTALEGKDDVLFRILSSDPEYAAQLAEYAFLQMKLRRVSILLEGSNKVYSESLGNAFRDAFTKQGGVVTQSTVFSREDTSSVEFVRSALKDRPDALFLIGNSVDLARLAQIAREIHPRIALLGDTVEEGLIKYGGPSLEGYIATQAFDRRDSAPHYLAFVERYEKRYKQPVGFAAVTSYDAGNAVMNALAQRRSGETLKAALLKYGPYPGLQGEIQFDRFGDTHRKAVIVKIEGGAFKVIR